MSNISSIDEEELEKFNKDTQDWWDKSGEFKMLHEINPIRIEYIISAIEKHFNPKSAQEFSLNDMKILDVGCGGGLISANIAMKGAKVTGIDANERNIKIAQKYAKSKNLDIEYIHKTVENHIEDSKKYDVVICCEVVEHVANLEDFVRNLQKLVADGGMLIFSTINRTKKSYFLAIIMAEYVLNWVPRKTHDHSKFVKPSEFLYMLKDTKMNLVDLKGLAWSVLDQHWRLSDEIDVNYFAVFVDG